MLKILIFSLITYTISFALVYKKPLIGKPYEWMMTILGLKDSLNCFICTPLYIALILSIMNIFLLPEYPISPSLVMFGEPEIFKQYVGSLFIDSFSISSIVYFMDQINSYVIENRSNLNVTINKGNKENLLLD